MDNLSVYKWILYGSAVIISVIAGCFDLKQHRIPNKLTLAGIILGVVLQAVFFKWQGLLQALVGFAAGLCWILTYALGILGAGDVKLFIAVSTILGWKDGLWVCALSIVTGGIWALAKTVFGGKGLKPLKRIYYYFLTLTASGKYSKYEPENAERDKFPFGMCVAFGSLIYIVYVWINR